MNLYHRIDPRNLTFTSSSLCPLAHCLHLPLSLTTALADAQLFHTSCDLSCSVVLLHVVFGLPTLRFSSGCHVSAVVQILVSSILSTWPIHFHFLSFIVSLTLVVLVLRCSPSLEILSGHLTLRICLMHLFWKVSSFFLSPSVVFHVSLPYVRIDTTRLLKKMILVRMEKFDELQIFLSLRNWAFALHYTVIITVRYIVTTPTRYVNVSTSSMVFPSI